MPRKDETGKLANYSKKLAFRNGLINKYKRKFLKFRKREDKMNSIPEEINVYLQYIARCIKETIPVSAIYLFGSYAKGNYRENSDLDIYVVTTDITRCLSDLDLEIRNSFERKIKIPLEILIDYKDEFERRSKWLNSVEREVIDTGVIINVV